MPPKIKELEKRLMKAGFRWEAGKGSHRHYVHDSGIKITISGQQGADAKKYQEKAVAEAIKAVEG